MNIGDFERAVDDVEKRRAELKAAIERIRWAKTKIVKLPGEPGDIIAGIGFRTFLNAVSPSLLRKLDKIGIAPGKISIPDKS